MHSAASMLLLAVITVSSITLFVPQLLRLLRTRDASGLSATSLLFGSVNYAAWTVYLHDARAWGLLVANVLAGVVWFTVVGLALRSMRPTASWLLPATWGLLLLGVVLFDRPVLGSVLGLGSLLTYTPQAVGVWQSDSVSGISAATWIITAVESVAWFAQSVGDGLVGGMMFGVVGTLTAASVLTALAVRGAARGALAPAPPVRPDPDLSDPDLSDPDLLGLAA